MIRVRKRVRDEWPRVQVSEAARTKLLNRFVDAIMTQDKAALMAVLSADVAWTSDGGGKARAALKPILGAEHAARFALGIFGRHLVQVRFTPITVNGESGLALYSRGQLIAIMSIRTDGSHILDVFSMLNPEKLSQIGVPFRLVDESP